VSARPSGLWAEIALALALITLATILLNAGVFWLVAEQGEVDRRTDLALHTARSLRADLETGQGKRTWKQPLLRLQKVGFPLGELWVVGPDLDTLAQVEGEPPRMPDVGLRAALYGRQEHVEVAGDPVSGRAIVVTEPVVRGGRVVAALRLEMPWGRSGPLGGRLGFLLSYTLLSGTFIAAFGYVLFKRRLVTPVQALQEATDRIAGGDFGHTLDLSSAKELVDLSTALNTMSSSLQQYRGATAEQLRSLEEANVQLQQVQEELIRSEKLASVGRLAAGIAHEVGNPLSAVLGYMSLLESRLEDPALERDLLGRTTNELERIQRIIRELLDYARPGTGLSLAVDPMSLLEEAADTVRPQAAFRHVEVRVETLEAVAQVVVEPDKVHQVLVNLLLNAAHALDGEGHITLWVAARGDEVVLGCWDTGPGFPVEDLGKVFDPFFTTKDPGQGTGLGLATSQRIVEGLGGWIRAANHPEGGAEITFSLPVADE
jgi:two-component system, NtrC family, sensor kinase